MKIGDIIKVYLPGESPWAECISMNEDGSFIGKIANELIATNLELRKSFSKKMGGELLESLHDFKKNDLVLFKEKDYGEFKSFEPIEKVNIQ